MILKQSTPTEKRERRVVRHSIYNLIRRRGQTRLYARKFIDQIVKEAIVSLKSSHA